MSNYIKKGQLWRTPLSNGQYEYYIVKDSTCIDENTKFYYGAYPPGTEDPTAWGIAPGPSLFTNFNVLEEREIKRVDYNKVHGIASIPVYHVNNYADLDIPVNGEDGLSFSYTGDELKQWLNQNSYCTFRIAEEFVDSIEISPDSETAADTWAGDYTYDLLDGFYILTTIGSGWRDTRVTVHLNPSSNLADAKIFDLYYDAN